MTSMGVAPRSSMRRARYFCEAPSIQWRSSITRTPRLAPARRSNSCWIPRSTTLSRSFGSMARMRGVHREREADVRLELRGRGTEPGQLGPDLLDDARLRVLGLDAEQIAQHLEHGQERGRLAVRQAAPLDPAHRTAESLLQLQ